MLKILKSVAAAAMLCLPALCHADAASAGGTHATLAQAQPGTEHLPGAPGAPGFERGPGGARTGFGSGGPAMGFGRGGPGAPGMGFGPAGRMLRRHRAMLMQQRWAALDLSDPQRERLRDLHDAHARQSIEQHAQMALARLDLQKLMRADRPDPEAVNAQIDRIARLRADQMKSAFELRMRAHALLTDEQLRKLRSAAPGGAPRGEM